MISVVRETPWEVLEDQIRNVPLLEPRNGALVYPYLKADVRLEEIAYADVRPTSLYVLRRHLAFQTQLAQDIAPHDPLNLMGSLALVGDDGVEVGLIRLLLKKQMRMASIFLMVLIEHLSAA